MTRTSTMSSLVLLGLGLSGCFSLDASLIADGGEDSAADSGEPGEDASDGAAAEDAGAAAEDGSRDGSIGDMVAPPPAMQCSQDSECAQDQFCGVSAEPRGSDGVIRVCRSRCSEELGCLLEGMIDRRASDLSVVNGSLLILTQPTKDSLGNVRDEPEVLRWDHSSPPIRLARGACDYFAALSETHVFCLGRGKLLRVAIAATSAAPEQLGESSVRRHWSTSMHLWWTVEDGDLKELWRVGLTGAQVPERMSADPSRMWLTGSEQVVYFAAPTASATSQVLFAQSPSLMDAPRNLGDFNAHWPYAVADADAIYFNTSYDSSSIMRTPLDGGATTRLSNQSSCGGTFQVSGPHLYWQCTGSSTNSNGAVLRIARNRVAPPGEPETLVDAPIALNGGYGSDRSFAVLEHSLVYIHPDDGRLFEVAF